MSTPQSNHALSEKEAAQYLSMSRSFLRQGRMNGDREGRTPTPPYLKIGRSVRYRIADLDRWLELFRICDSRSILPPLTHNSEGERSHGIS